LNYSNAASMTGFVLEMKKSGGKRLMLAEPHGNETVGREIGLQKYLRGALGAEEGFGSQIPAADGAFHGGGPPGGSPVAGQKKTRDGCLLLRAPAIDSWLGGKCGGGFLDDGGFNEFCPTSGGKSMADLRQTEVDDFLA
jgi:hypothetical protein